MKSRLYLDTRHRDTSRPCPLYLCISRWQRSAFYPLGISLLPSRWDAQARRPKQLPPSVWPERAMFVRLLDAHVSRLELELMRAEMEGELHGLDAIGVRDYLARRMQPDVEGGDLFMPFFTRFARTRRAQGTRVVYLTTLHTLARYGAEKCRFCDLSREWAKRFVTWMEGEGMSVNTRAMRMRHVITALNAAVEEGKIRVSPLRGFRLQTEETRKKDLPVPVLRSLLEEAERTHAVELDFFALSFYLIGMNTGDMLALRDTDMQDGRLRYRRAKTGKLYDIRVEPEAEAIIARHRGTGGRLLDFGTGCQDKVSFTSYLVKRLHRRRDGLSVYWARHSWATVAANDLGLPQDTISRALGHSFGVRVTQVYIDYDTRRVDEANRAVIDFVLGK